MKFRMKIMLVSLLICLCFPTVTQAKVVNRKARVYNFYTEIHLSKSGKVKRKLKCVRFITADGNVWAWTLGKHEHYKKGQKVVLKMNMKKNLYDSEILKVR